MLTLTACNNNSADMYSYSDGSGNTYFITETTITYSPVTPLESSSGLYSGGEPANITIDKATFQNVVSLLEDAIADTESQVENRAMMTGYIQKGEGDNSTSIVLAPKADKKAAIEDALTEIVNPNPTMNNETFQIQGELLNTKGGPSVDGVYLPENEYDEYIGKMVKVEGEIATIEGGSLVNEKGEYSSGFEGSRKVMTNVHSIEVIE